MQILGFALAAVIGLSLGLLGGGGSILTVPVFVYVLGIAAKPAIAMSLPVVGITSLVGAVMHWRLGHVKVRTALIFGIFAMAGAFAGARLAGAVSGAVQLTILAVVMLVAALSMLRRRPEGIDPGRGPAHMALVVPVALVVGVLTGLVGIGGGFLIVPALALLARVPMREAVGTSLLVIALNSAAGFAGYLGSVPVDWGFMTAFAAVAVAGAFGGTALARRVSGESLRRVFGVFLILVGAFVLYMNRGVFTGSTASAARAPSSLAIGAR